MKHFHEQEASLLQATDKKTFLTIAVISILLAFTYTNAQAKNLTKQDLAGCQTIKVQYIKNGFIEADSIDEYTLNLSHDEAVTRALNITLGSSYDFQKINSNCAVSINLVNRN